MYKFSNRSKSRMKNVHPELILIFEEAIKISPIDFGIPKHGGIRTAEEQNQLFNEDLSKADGYDKLSKHQSGDALDFYAFIGGKASWNKVHLSMIATVIMLTAKRLKEEGKISIDIRWGGTFGSKKFHGWDYPHIEISK
jgi:peptidoglycan L-alanyl-D-glutamate endopeptidase CwlK